MGPGWLSGGGDTRLDTCVTRRIARPLSDTRVRPPWTHRPLANPSADRRHVNGSSQGHQGQVTKLPSQSVGLKTDTDEHRMKPLRLRAVCHAAVAN